MKRDKRQILIGVITGLIVGMIAGSSLIWYFEYQPLSSYWGVWKNRLIGYCNSRGAVDTQDIAIGYPAVGNYTIDCFGINGIRSIPLP